MALFFPAVSKGFPSCFSGDVASSVISRTYFKHSTVRNKVNLLFNVSDTTSDDVNAQENFFSILRNNRRYMETILLLTLEVTSYQITAWKTFDTDGFEN